MELQFLRLKNFRSHADSPLDFKKFNVCVILGCRGNNFDSSNGSGKSSIFEAVTWCLFGNTSEKDIDFLKWGEKEGFVKLKFIERGSSYLVKRTLKKNKDKITSKLIFKVKKDGIWEELTEHGIGAKINTQRKIMDLIKADEEIFLNTSYIRQGDIGSFMKLRPRERREVFSRPEGLMVYQKAYKLVRKEFLEEKTTLKVTVEKIADFKSNYRVRFSDEGDLSQLMSEYEELKKKKESIQRRIDEVEESKKKHSESESAKEQIKILQKAIDKEESKVKEIKEEYEDVLENGKQIEEDIDVMEKKLVKMDRDGLIAERTQLDSAIEAAEEKIDGLKESIAKKQVQLKKIKMVCSECGAELDEEQFQEKKSKLKKEIEEMSSSLESLYEENNTASEKIESLEKKIKASDGLVKDISKLKSRLEMYNIALNKLDQAKKDLKVVKSDNEDKIASLKKKVVNDESEDVTFETLKERYDSVSQKIGRMKEKVVSLKQVNEEKKEERLKFKKLVEEKNAIKKNVQALQYVSDMFSNTGIQAQIVKEAVPELEQYTNDVLGKFEKSDIQLKIVTDDEAFDWRIKNRGQDLSYNSLSGGEKLRANFAFRIGNGIRCSHVKGCDLDFLLIDEIADLDTDGIEDFVQIVKELSKIFKHIVVISHIPEIKEYFNHQIIVSQKNNTSKIQSIK